MANRFYYNGELIRTSKDHTYTHAALNINTGKCYGCSSTYKGAQANIDRMISGYRTGIENSKLAIKALEKGARGYWVKIGGGRSYFERFFKEDTIESFEEYIKACEDKLDWIAENLRVVELEMR